MLKRGTFVRLAYGIVLFVIFSLVWISPLQAAPQVSGNLVVAITSPSPGSTVTSTITVTASVGPLGALVAGVQFKLDGVDLGAEDTTAPYSVPWNTVLTTNGSHTLTAVARNPGDIRVTSDPVTVTVFNDKTPPTVSITFPASGSTVGNTITVTANASDNVAVAGVQFKLDGVNLGAEATTAPSQAMPSYHQWPSSSVSSAHTTTPPPDSAAPACAARSRAIVRVTKSRA